MPHDSNLISLSAPSPIPAISPDNRQQCSLLINNVPNPKSLPDAPQKLLPRGAGLGRAEVDAVVADGGGAEGLVAERVLAEEGEFLWGGLEDRGDAAFAGDVDARVDHDGRAVELAIDFFVPAFLAGRAFEECVDRDFALLRATMVRAGMV